MIGTEKYLPAPDTALMQEVTEKITATREDKEDAFLKLTAAYLLLQEAGKQLPVNDYRHATAPPDNRPQLSADSASLINQLLKTNEEALLAYALHRVAASGKVVRPELVPALLNKAAARKDNSLYLQVCGERGPWLARLSEQWKMLYLGTNEDIWQTGTSAQRREYLNAVRKTDPQLGRALLAGVIEQESANLRYELLNQLIVGLSADDEAFLISQTKDKSQKVKQTAYTLLKLLPQSAISRQYATFLKEALLLKEERVLLIGKKKLFEVNKDIAYPQALADSGLEKMSSQKGIEDRDYWVAQAIEHLHPHFWQKSYGLTADQTVQLFMEHKQKELFLTSLIHAAFLHKHQPLAHALLRQHAVSHPSILQVLPLQERWSYAAQFTDNSSNAAQLLPLLMDEAYVPIPAGLCRKLLEIFIHKPYDVSQPLYHSWALYMPAGLLPYLQELAKIESEHYQQRFFRNVVTEMSRIIETREQLNASI